MFLYMLVNLFMHNAGSLSFQCHHINCFDVQCDELIKGLHKRTNGLVKKLLQRLMDDHNEASEQ